MNLAAEPRLVAFRTNANKDFTDLMSKLSVAVADAKDAFFLMRAGCTRHLLVQRVTVSMRSRRSIVVDAPERNVVK